MKWVLLLPLLLAACVPQRASTPTLTRVFSCDGGYRLTLRTQSDLATLYLPDATYELRVRRERGAELLSGKDAPLIRIKDEKAWLRATEEQPQRTCRLDRRAALWEDARFRGVDFRAENAAQGWYLEIDRKKVLFVGEYGQQIQEFPHASPQVSDTRAQTIYRGLSESGRQLELKLEAGLCVDRGSGERFGTRVRLRIDDQTRFGCGRYLSRSQQTGGGE